MASPAAKEFAQDAKVGHAGRVTSHRVLTTSAKITKSMQQEFAADAARQRTHDRIDRIKNKGNRNGK